MPEREPADLDGEVAAAGYDSYCGIYCGACDTLLANEQGGVIALAREWKRTVDELRCGGCRSSVNSVFCRNCEMRRCARTRRIQFCYECADFPCTRLVSFRNDQHPHHSAVLKNLDDIRANGLACWLRQ